MNILVDTADTAKEHKRLKMAGYRKTKRLKALASNNVPEGRKICTRCLKQKRLTEFSKKGRSNNLRKMCDACLTAVYLTPSRKRDGFDEVWWRARAYTCNTAARAMLAKSRGVKVSEIKTSDLPYVCKPQDIAAIFEAQDGKCYYCHTTLTPDRTSVDHATPLCKNGAHAPHNFRMTCTDCNHLKWTRNEGEFTTFIKEYASRFKATEHEDKEPRG